MTTKQSSPQSEVKRLAGIAKQAALRERAQRSNLSVRGKKAAHKGLLIGAGSVAALLLVSTLRRHHHPDAEGEAREHSPGIFESAGAHLLSLVRWGVTASHVWSLAHPHQQPAMAAEPLSDA